MTHLTEVEIEFRDGKLVCRGHVRHHDGEFFGMEGDQVTERAKTVHVEVVEDGRLYDWTTNESRPLDPGEYMIGGEGLWKRVCGTSPQ